jgi:chromosome segregation ATPase
MAEPTLKDVLRAISEIRGEMATKADLAKLDAKVAKLDAKVEDLDAKVEKGFAELDRELTGHAALHREIEKDIEALKRRPARTAARAPRRPRTP